jgi:hypothetical protein
MVETKEDLTTHAAFPPAQRRGFLRNFRSRLFVNVKIVQEADRFHLTVKIGTRNRDIRSIEAQDIPVLPLGVGRNQRAQLHPPLPQ